MPEVKLPFNGKKENIASELMSGVDVHQSLPGPLREVCSSNPHLLEYLNLLVAEGVAIPAYYPQLSKKLQDVKPRNLIYPVGDGVFIHIYSAPQEERDYYIPIEPGLTENMDGVMSQVETKLIELTRELEDATTEEKKKEAFLRCIDKIFSENGHNGGNSHIDGNGRESFLGQLLHRGNGATVDVTPRQLEVLKYLVVRDKVGTGILEPMMREPYIEDISCSGLGHLFVEHKIFGSLKSAVTFSTFDDLDTFVLRLGERIKRPVTMRKPIVDATLPDGSRVNIVYGREISQRGSNFSIRKFSETPFSILEIVDFGTLNYMMVAYLWMVINAGLNLFVVGETASGKTTMLNSLTTFIPLTNKVVSIEDTPELQVPHQNWIREVTKPGGQDDSGAEVTMFDLLKAALRQRPNVIIVGEIRGAEGNIAFQAMQTGHQAMATFHASSVEKLVQRLTGSPINVPKTYVDNLNVVVIQNAVRLPNGKKGRRTQSISEIVSYDPSSNTFSFVEVFRWDPAEDRFEFVAEKNSYILEEKIAVRNGLPADKKWQVYQELEQRAKILERLHKEKGVTNFYELLKALAVPESKNTSR